MISIDYKILFEVRVLHDYYLFGPTPLKTGGAKQAGGDDPPEERETKSFFAMDEAAQASRFQALLRSGRYDVRKDLAFILGSADRGIFRDLHLRMIETATGFFVGMEVQPGSRAHEPKRFRPTIEPGEDTVLTFGVAVVNPSFGAITSLRMDHDPGKTYHFSNIGDHEEMSLARPPERLGTGQQYRMGDLALVGGVLRQAVVDNTGEAKFWAPVEGTGFVSQGDRNLSTNEEWFREWLPTIQRPAGQLLGVIRIALKTPDEELSPLTADGLLATKFVKGQARPVHPAFDLRFLGLTTYWRYRKPGGFDVKEAAAIQVNAGTLLERVEGDFVTKKPRTLARELPPFISTLSAPGSFPMPNAQPGGVRAGKGKLYSEVQLNHVPVKQ